MRRLRTRLQEYQSVLPGEAFTLFSAHLSARVLVTLITNQHDSCVRVSILTHFLQPSRQVSECVAPRNIVHQQGTCSTAVVRPCDRFEGLLAGRIPDLKLNVLLCDLDCASTEFHTNCQVVLLTEAFVGKLKQQAGFSNT